MHQQDRDARRPMESNREKNMLDGIPRVTGAREARRSNFHNRSFERVDVPE
jgi:hypothetical protein